MRMFLILALALLIAGPVFAGPKKGEKKPACPAAQAVDQITKKLTLTDDQKAKLDGIKKEFGPKLAETMKSAQLTPEQKKAGQEAAKAAKAAGKKGKEAKQAVEDAVKITPEQKTKLAEAQKQLKTLQKDLKEKVLQILTPEQKEQLKPKKKDGEKKKEKK